VLQRFFADDSGQDLIEYSLLAALIAIVSIVTWQQIATTIGTGYAASDTGVQTLSSCTPDPGGGGC
jgi:pilus assembly protein Flp/PilA